MMQILSEIKDVKDTVGAWKRDGLSIGLVPTMGFLHEGHGSLITAALRENDKVVVSIFVNPIQFGEGEDLETYPRDIDRDAEYCRRLGADLIFLPEADSMYPEGFSAYVDVSGITEVLCGESRPGHFRGVCTVVSKLFHIVEPDRAYFGEKDAQQLAVIRQMVRDLNIPAKVVGCPIVREADGLAKSSRNSYLSDREREAALILSKALKVGLDSVEDGECSAEIIEERVRELIESEPLARIDYVKVVDGFTMNEIDRVKDGALLALAVYIGRTRLIDNACIKRSIS